MCVRRGPAVAPSKRQRSAVTNGSRLFLEGDERSPAARRLRDLIRSFSADFDGTLSEIDTALVRTAAALTLKSEQMQADLAAGRPVDSDALIRLASTSRRALAAVSARVITNKPTGGTALQNYLDARAAAAEEDDDDGEEV